MFHLSVQMALLMLERAIPPFATAAEIEEAAHLLIEAGCPVPAAFAAADRIHRRNARVIAERARACPLSRVGQVRRSRRATFA